MKLLSSFRHFFCCSALLCVAVTVHAEMIVVTDQNHPVSAVPAHTRVIEPDAANHLQQQLSAGLPDDPKQAAWIAKERLERSGTVLQQSMQATLQGVVDAWVLGVAKVPAVIVDRQFVIYGETDVNQAIEQIRKYREQTR